MFDIFKKLFKLNKNSNTQLSSIKDIVNREELKRIVCHIKDYHDEVIPWEELYYIIGYIAYLVDQKEQCQNNNMKYKKLK